MSWPANSVMPSPRRCCRASRRLSKSEGTSSSSMCICRRRASWSSAPCISARRWRRWRAAAGYDLEIIDPRTAFATPERFAGVRLQAEWPQDGAGDAPLDRYCALVAVTHDPKIDDFPILAALKADCFYVGALGSRKTHARRCERLMAQGATTADLARIDAPIGLDIAAASPGEIAVAIMGQIIASFRRRHDRRRRGAAEGIMKFGPVAVEQGRRRDPGAFAEACRRKAHPQGQAPRRRRPCGAERGRHRRGRRRAPRARTMPARTRRRRCLLRRLPVLTSGAFAPKRQPPAGPTCLPNMPGCSSPMPKRSPASTAPIPASPLPRSIICARSRRAGWSRLSRSSLTRWHARRSRRPAVMPTAQSESNDSSRIASGWWQPMLPALKPSVMDKTLDILAGTARRQRIEHRRRIARRPRGWRGRRGDPRTGAAMRHGHRLRRLGDQRHRRCHSGRDPGSRRPHRTFRHAGRSRQSAAGRRTRRQAGSRRAWLRPQPGRKRLRLGAADDCSPAAASAPRKSPAWASAGC